MQLFQIGTHMPYGTFKTWRPDGSVISGKEAFPAQYGASQMEFLYRVSSVKENFTGAMGSGPSEPGDPTTQGFAGNWSLPVAKDGSDVMVGLLLIP